MGNVAKLIIKKKEDNPEALKVFEETELPGEKDQVQEIIASYPTVYTHSWEDGALMRYPNLPKLLYIGFKLIPQIPYKIGV